MTEINIAEYGDGRSTSPYYSLRGWRPGNRGRGRGARKPRKNEGDWGEGTLPSPQSPSFFLASLAPLPPPRLRRPRRLPCYCDAICQVVCSMNHLLPRQKEGDDVRDIVKHDFRSVFLYHVLPNANRMELSEMRQWDWQKTAVILNRKKQSLQTQ